MALLLGLGAQPRAFADTSLDRCHELRAGPSRADAIAACDHELALRASPENMLASVEVLVARPEAPTMAELFRAHLLAEAAVRQAPGEPWGFLARLAIARSWGDLELVSRRLDELERVAPTHVATSSGPTQADVPRLVGWAALLALCALTVVHALWRRVSGRMRVRLASFRVFLVSLVAGLSLVAGRVSAEEFPIDDANPEQQVPTAAEIDRRPMDFAYYLQELTERGEHATQRGDHAAAVRYYRALARAVPDVSAPQQKLCAAELAMGDRAAAIPACRAALGLGGVRAEDFSRFGDLVLADASPPPFLVDDVAAAARHLAAREATRVPGWHLLCRVGVRTSSIPILEECAAGLSAAGASDAITHVYRWSLAMLKGDLDDARRWMERSRAEGAGAEAVARMETAMSQHERWPDPRTLLVAGVVAAVAGALFLALRLSRRRTSVA